MEGRQLYDLCLNSQDSGDITRKIYMYDTYRGMPKPGHLDVNYRGQKAMTEWQTHQLTSHNSWTFAPLQEVKKNVVSTGYSGYTLCLWKAWLKRLFHSDSRNQISFASGD